MTKAAEDYESIARHLKELEAEKQLAMTGSSAPVAEKVGEYAAGWTTYGDNNYLVGLTPQYHDPAILRALVTAK